MQALTAVVMFELYETCRLQMVAKRALAILAAAMPQEKPSDLGKLTVGQREICLLTILEATFGTRLESVTTCPFCDAALEFTLDLKEILSSFTSQIAVTELNFLTVEGYTVHYHLPTAQDLVESSADAPRADDGNENLVRQNLLQRCIQAAEKDGTAIGLADIPESVLTKVIQRMAELDPASDLVFELNCAACGQVWPAPFDTTNYMWDKIHQKVSELLQEVFLLSKAYHWSECDILGLPDWRRHAYLELAYG